MSFSLVGLASGLDTASIISQLIELERLPIKNLETQKSSLQKKQDVLRSINTKLNTLKNLAADLKLASFYQTNAATVSDNTVLKATASSSAAAGSYTIEVVQKATQHVVASAKNKDEEVSLSNDGIIKINGKEISFSYAVKDENGEIVRKKTWKEMYDDLATQINNANAGVKAAVIKVTSNEYQLVLTSEQTGESIELTDEANLAVLKAFGFYNEVKNLDEETGQEVTQTVLNEIQPARGAIIKVNGLEIHRSSNTLDDVIPGLTIDLLKDSGTVTVEVSRDTDKIVKKIEDFVKAYNDVVSTIRNNTGKEQILQGDSTLRMLDSQLQSILYHQPPIDEKTSKPVLPNDYMFLHQLGLEIDKGTTSGSLMTGTIQFDQEKFKEKLAQNPDDVIKLLTDDQFGIMSLLDKEISAWTSSTKGVLTSKINGFSEEITLVDERIERLEERLLRKEEQLKRQFAAMEVALAQLQSQQQWLSAQLSAMTVSIGKKS